MPKVITHEGNEYVLKSDYDAAKTSMEGRIKQLATQKNESDSKTISLQNQLDQMQGQITTGDALQTQIASLQAELTNANQRYNRHAMLSQIGINDESVRRAFEWQYNELGGDDKPGFDSWIDGLKSNPEGAPAILRSYLQTKPEGQPQQMQPQPDIQPSEVGQIAWQPKQPAPPANNGVISSQTNGLSNQQILERASMDPSFYKSNRELVMSLYRTGQKPTAPRIPEN